MRVLKFRAWSKELGMSDEFNVDAGMFECVLPDAVMQFTGLKDKNDRDIYEGDILKGDDNPDYLVQVVFGQFGVRNVETEEIIDNVFGWYTKVIPTDSLSKCEPFCYDMPLTKYYIKECEFEIVGNIYENKELLSKTN